MAALTLSLGSCAARSSGPYTPQAESARDSPKAQRLTQDAAAILDKEPAKAERLLREALTADLYHGPAHNDLGVLYLKQGKLYEAAGEFEWARKLLPGHPDPRVNLALVLERAGRVDEAITGYRSALEVYPEYLPAVQGLARLQLKAGRADEHTPVLLEDIALRGETPRWREWARGELARRPAR
jgi:tetratricopeptide (TPR) repeat protein